MEEYNLRIVNRDQFLKLPNGVVYSRYQSLSMFSGLEVKEETLTNDWVYTSLMEFVDAHDSGEMADIMIKAEEEGTEFRLDVECGQRDGFFEGEEYFAIYDKEDILKLFERMKSVVESYPHV